MRSIDHKRLVPSTRAVMAPNQRGRSNSLPRYCLITPELSSCKTDPMPRLHALLQAGLQMVQYRCQHSDTTAWQDRLDAVNELCRKHQALLIVNADPKQYQHCDSDGVHLNSARLMSCRRRPVARHYWLSASCHDPVQLRRATEIGVDFVTLSPVKRTHSHPGSKALGWGRFHTWAANSPLPIYALGGLQIDDLITARRHHAHGIALISGLWQAHPLPALREQQSQQR